jgi:hypothetical protein
LTNRPASGIYWGRSKKATEADPSAHWEIRSALEGGRRWGGTSNHPQGRLNQHITHGVLVRYLSGFLTRGFATRRSEKQYNAAESCSVTLSVAEVTVEASVENWWININSFGLAVGGAALHWF